MVDTCISLDQEKPFASTIIMDLEATDLKSEFADCITGPKGDN